MPETRKARELTQDRLKELLRYDPSTGIFVHTKSRGGKVAGSVAGCLDAYGYVQIYVDRRNYKAHILAWLYMTGVKSELWLDHCNRVRNDNRWVNIREATPHENNCNQGLRKDSSSGVKGVSWDRLNSKWRVEISTKSGRLRLGRFADMELAALVSEEAREKYHGVFCV